MSLAHTIIQSDVGHTIIQTEESTTIEQNSPETTIEVTELVLPGEAVGGGVTDHGALTGLGDDDHPQYLLKSGGTMTGSIRLPAVDGEGIGIDGQPGFPALFVVDEGGGDFSLWLNSPGGGAYLGFYSADDSFEMLASAVDIGSSGAMTLNAVGGVNNSGRTFRNVAAPTAGTHVGDRNYSDARYPQSTTIRHIVTLTQAAYDLLAPPLSNTLYVING